MAKILVVEDDPSVAESIGALLKFNRHTVEWVADGLEAFNRLKACDYDLVVLDLWVPGLSGEELCIKYRENGGETPILMLTGKRRMSDRVSGLDTWGPTTICSSHLTLKNFLLASVPCCVEPQP